MLRAFVCCVPFVLCMATAKGQAEATDPPETHTAELQAQLQEHVKSLLALLNQQTLDPAEIDFSNALVNYQAIRALLDQHHEAMLKTALQPAEYALNYAGFLYETSPRLTGNVIHVGETRRVKTIADALAVATEGDLILVDAGTYEFTDVGGMMRNAVILDLAVVGQGRTRTTLQVSQRASTGVSTAIRILIEAASLDGNDNEFIYMRMRPGVGTARVRDCKIFNYNSGAGGSNAIGGNNCILLFDSCEFEGLTGRSYRPERGNDQTGGNAFDLRGDNWLYVRQTQFIENDEVQRVTHPAVYDGCVTMNVNQRSGGGINPYASGHTFIRNNQAYIDDPEDAIPFTYATDDLIVAQHAAGLSEDAPEEAVELSKRLQLHRNLRYWIGMMFHDDIERREIAAARVEVLTGQEVDLGRVAFEELPQSLRPRYSAYAEAGRLANWYDQNHERLTWNDDTGRYDLSDAAADDADPDDP